MNKFFSFLRSHAGLLSVMGLFALALFLPETALAQKVVDYGAAKKGMVTALAPIFQTARYGLLIACIGFAALKAFKASRGEGKEWINVLILLVVASFLIMPDTFLRMFGMTELADLAEDLFGTGL